MAHRITFVALLFTLASCGGPEASAPDAGPVVRIQVDIRGTRDGLPLTITGDPLPVPTTHTVFGNYEGQYEMTVTPEALEATTFDVLTVDAANHTGHVWGTYSVVNPGGPYTDIRSAIAKHGAPSTIGFRFSGGRIVLAVWEWPDGSGSSFISGL